MLYFDAECLVFWNTHNFHYIVVARFMVCASFHSTLIDDRNGYLHLWCCFFISCLFYLWLNLLTFFHISIFSTPHFVAPSLQPCSFMSEFDVRFEFFCISLFSFPFFFKFHSFCLMLWFSRFIWLQQIFAYNKIGQQKMNKIEMMVLIYSAFFSVSFTWSQPAS